MNDRGGRMLREPRACGRGVTAVIVIVCVGLLGAVQYAIAQSSPVLVSISEVDSTILVDMRYAGEDNFVGTRIDGYEASVCLLTPEAARALARANEIVGEDGYLLYVFDCYRPQRAVDHFVRWSHYLLDQSTKETYYPNVNKRQLFELGYISSKSGHSRGSTVDVGLATKCPSSGGVPHLLDMGTPFDFFDPRSHTDSPDIAAEQSRRRRLLVDAMRSAGFRNYPKEWWHFTLIGEPYPGAYFDAVVE